MDKPAGQQPPTTIADPVMNPAIQLDALFASLKATDHGLTTAEAAAARTRHGGNVLADAPRLRLLAKLGRRMVEPLVAILLVAALVAAGAAAAATFVFQEVFLVRLP
jgi:Mg2+-importing ATPase